MFNVGKQIKFFVKSHGECSGVILERIGFGYLAKTDDGLFCSLHHGFTGELYATNDELFNNENEARAVAEATRSRIS